MYCHINSVNSACSTISKSATVGNEQQLTDSVTTSNKLIGYGCDVDAYALTVADCLPLIIANRMRRSANHNTRVLNQTYRFSMIQK